MSTIIEAICMLTFLCAVAVYADAIAHMVGG